jgi:hypothetical protein
MSTKRLVFSAVVAAALVSLWPIQWRSVSALGTFSGTDQASGRTDERLTQALFDLIARNPEIKSAVASTLLIQASIRG